MTPQESVRPEVEVLLFTVTCDIRRKRRAQASPFLITLLPGWNLDDIKAWPREEKWHVQIGPECVAVEVSAIQCIPGRVGILALCMFRRIKPLCYQGAVDSDNSHTIGCKVSQLVWSAVWKNRGPLLIQRCGHLPGRRILRYALHLPQITSTADRGGYL